MILLDLMHIIPLIKDSCNKIYEYRTWINYVSLVPKWHKLSKLSSLLPTEWIKSWSIYIKNLFGLWFHSLCLLFSLQKLLAFRRLLVTNETLLIDQLKLYDKLITSFWNVILIFWVYMKKIWFKVCQSFEFYIWTNYVC